MESTPLGALGLSSTDERVFEQIARVTGATGAELAQLTGLPLEPVSVALQHLITLDLVALAPGSDDFFTVRQIEAAVTSLIKHRQDELERARAYAYELAHRASAAEQYQRAEDLVAVVTGSAKIREAYYRMQRLATRELLLFDVPPYPDSGGGVPNALTEERTVAGVTYRTVYDSAVFDNPEWAARVRMEMALGEHGRVIDKLPFKLAIADRDFALLPLQERTPTGEQAALLVKPSVLVESLSALFEAMWERAVPLRPAGDELVPDFDPQIVELTRLLAAGMQDARIGRYLGVSERTVRRRVADMFEALGVETKFQAAVRARELGWI